MLSFVRNYSASDTQPDRLTRRAWSSLILKPHLPFGLLATLISIPISTLPFLFHYPKAQLSLSAHTDIHTTAHKDPEDYISSPQHSPKPIPELTKSCERRDWWDGLEAMLQRGRNETVDLTTLPRHLCYPYDDITTDRDLQAGTAIKCD